MRFLAGFGTANAVPRYQVAAIGLAMAGLALLYYATEITVVIVDGGEASQWRTHARAVGSALADLGIALEPNDRVIPDLETRLERGSTIEITRAREVWIETPDEVRLVRTPEALAANILREAGYTLFPGDRVWVDGLPLADPVQSAQEPPSRIRFEPGFLVELQIEDQTLSFRSGEATLGQALRSYGFDLYEADILRPGANTAIEAPLEVELIRSTPLTIHSDGANLRTRVVADNVGEALAASGIALLGLDYSKPGADEDLPDGGSIQVIRVEEKVVVEQTPIQFETRFEGLADLEIDEQRLLEPGSFGVSASRIRVRYEDGQEVSRAPEGEWVARDPEPRRVGYGTNIVVRTMSTGDGQIEYWRSARMYATSYSPSRAGVSPDAPNFGITASGQPLKKGLVAIDRSLIPFGTRLYVPGYGFAVAADTGSGVRGRWIDLGYEDDNWVSWHQYVTVYFLTPVPPPQNIVWIFP